MGNTHVSAVADQISPDAVTFASLPLPLARLVFLALPADARGRASCVCRAWRDVLERTISTIKVKLCQPRALGGRDLKTWDELAGWLQTLLSV